MFFFFFKLNFSLLDACQYSFSEYFIINIKGIISFSCVLSYVFVILSILYFILFHLRTFINMNMFRFYSFFIFSTNSMFLIDLFWAFLSIVISVVGLLIAIAFYTLAERKIMGGAQRRQGPHTVGSLELGVSGFLQPVGDGLKLIIKEMVIPSRANIQLFLMAPLLLLTLSLTIWGVIPFSPIAIDFWSEVSILVFFSISSLSIYGVIIAGWASNSTYAFIGALRSTAQMISYEIAIGFVLVGVALWAQSLNLVEIVKLQTEVFFFWALWPLALVMFVSALAETNRVPFDLVEAEAEIVAGYNVEYSCILFAMFFLAEYSFMLSMSGIITILFFGGWLAPVNFLSFVPGFFWFCLKTGIIAFLFIIVRATLPRVRYDQLMNLGWAQLLPFLLGFIIFLASVVYVFDFSSQSTVPAFYTHLESTLNWSFFL